MFSILALTSGKVIVTWDCEPPEPIVFEPDIILRLLGGFLHSLILTNKLNIVFETIATNGCICEGKKLNLPMKNFINLIEF